MSTRGHSRSWKRYLAYAALVAIAAALVPLAWVVTEPAAEPVTLPLDPSPATAPAKPPAPVVVATTPDPTPVATPVVAATAAPTPARVAATPPEATVVAATPAPVAATTEPTPIPEATVVPEPTPDPTPAPTLAPTPVATPAPTPTAEPETCADTETGRCTPWDSIPISFEGNDTTGYVAFWNAGPRTVCSVATPEFGALGAEHHAAAREATAAWNDAVGGEPALFAYQPDCPDGVDDAFDDDMRDCPGGLINDPAGETIQYIPIFWVDEAALNEGATGCAAVKGSHNYSSEIAPHRQGWKASVVAGTISGDYAVTIMYELGHVLYLGHTCDERSIMHTALGCTTRYEPSGIIPADYLHIRATLGRD